MRKRVRVLGQQLLSDNWGRLMRYNIEYRRGDGTWQHQAREVYDRGNAAAVLLCDPSRGTVVLTRQFRFPVHLNGDDPGLIEVCAGLLEGDDPETCARKEAVEETGYEIEKLTHVLDAYMSPGSVTEKLSLFIGTYEPQHRVAAGGGLADEGEDIEVIEMPFEKALEMVTSGRIVDAKTIMLLQHAALAGIFGTERGQ